MAITLPSCGGTLTTPELRRVDEVNIAACYDYQYRLITSGRYFKAQIHSRQMFVDYGGVSTL